MLNGSSILELVKDLRNQFKTFLREEIHLAKAELSEKISRLGKDSVNIAIGGFVAYAGLIVFLGALGMLIAYFLQRQGLNPFLSVFIGLGAIGFVIIAVGVIMLLTGLNAMKKESLAPQRTIETLHRVKGTELHARKPAAPRPKKDERSSKEIEAAVLQTEGQMAETLEELGDRLTMTHLRRQAKAEVQKHPYRWSLVAMGAGVCGSYLMKRKLVR
jgi:Putative Actinobacterial Holin-X, holin superfamily III